MPNKNKLTWNTKEGRILNLLRRTSATEVLFHHRFPTSTINVRRACHPFSSRDVFENNYITVHNGVLFNEDDLAKDHKKRGIDYRSKMSDNKFNDSEALAFDIALYLEGKQKELKAQGSIAFVTVKRDKTGKPVTLYFGRNDGSPLKLSLNQHGITLASEGKGEDIEPQMLYAFNYKNKTISKEPLKISDYLVTYYQSNQYDYKENWYDGSLDDKEVTAIKESLMKDCGQDASQALEMANDSLADLNARLAEADKAIDEKWNDKAFEEYEVLSDQVNYLQDAIQELESDLDTEARSYYRTEFLKEEV